MENYSNTSNSTTCGNDFVSHYSEKYKKREEWVNTGTQDVVVFYPTMEEFSDFPGFIKKIEKSGAHLASGICKIVPPKEWNPRPSHRSGDYSDIDNFVIHTPVKETIEGSSGCFTRSIKVYRKRMTVKDFKKMAVSKEFSNPKPEVNLIDLERHYWRSLLFGEPIYGADTPGTLYDADVKEFNMKNLGTVLDLLNEQKIKIAGVNTTFLYFGMWKATFPWHVEDMDLYSINYLHYGDPKFWYAIPSQAAEKFERLACQQFPDGSIICKAFLRHKLYIISPSVLKNHSIPYGTMVQYPNEFIITFPKGYHMGFNVGYNCAESTNFALERWIDFGKNAVLCHCREDGVEIDMRPFMIKYRPEEFNVWHEYWYGERHSIIADIEKLTKEQKVEIKDPVLEAIYSERQKKLFHAKRTVKNLWSQSPVNLFHEKEYNIKRSKMFPHCAVCQYFIPRRFLISQKLSRAQGLNLPKTSRRFITDQQFYKSTLLPKERRKVKEDLLLECVNCHVVVHKHCYPDLDYFPDYKGKEIQNFFCIRCYNRDDMLIRSASCAVCELRGGALIETAGENGIQQFVHVICAIIHPQAQFLEPEKRKCVYRSPPKWLMSYSPVAVQSSSFSNFKACVTNRKTDLSFATPSLASQEELRNSSSLLNENDKNMNDTKIEHNSLNIMPSTSTAQSNFEIAARYQCEVCNGLSHNLIQCQVCLQTEENSAAASLRYHITCAPLADMTFERRDILPFAIAVCPFHNSSHVLPKPDTRLIHAGDRVIVCLKSVIEDEKLNKNINSDTASVSSNHIDCSLVRKGRVIRSWESLYCTVDFFDGSVSTDLFTCDIRRCECYQFGCKNNHMSGFLVYVYWHDQQIYEAYYRGKAPTRKYLIELDFPANWDINSKTYNNDVSSCNNNEIVEAEQDEVFVLDEPLPEEIRNALLKRRLPIDVL